MFGIASLLFRFTVFMPPPSSHVTIGYCIDKLVKTADVVYIKPENILKATGGNIVMLHGMTAFLNMVVDSKFISYSQANSPSDRVPIWVCKNKELHIASHHPESVIPDT